MASSGAASRPWYSGCSTIQSSAIASSAVNGTRSPCLRHASQKKRRTSSREGANTMAWGRCDSGPQRERRPPRGRRVRLGAVLEQTGDRAAPAFRLDRLAQVAPVQDQPVVAVVQVLWRHEAQQSFLDLERRAPLREAGAV